MGAIHVSDVSHQFGATQALSRVAFHISPGEQVALLGASGSGKTTLLKLLGLQQQASAGEVSVMDGVLGETGAKELRKIRAKLAMLPQDFGLVPNLRVVQNVLLGRSGQRNLVQTFRDLLWPAVQDREDIFKILDRMGVAEKMYDRVDSLSGGQQQRVALARALFQGAEILLADEPLSAVDPARARDVLTLLTSLSREQGSTLVVSLHQVSLAREFFPRVIGLKDGELVFDGKPTAGELETLYDL